MTKSPPIRSSMIIFLLEHWDDPKVRPVIAHLLNDEVVESLDAHLMGVVQLRRKMEEFLEAQKIVDNSNVISIFSRRNHSQIPN